MRHVEYFICATCNRPTQSWNRQPCTCAHPAKPADQHLSALADNLRHHSATTPNDWLITFDAYELDTLHRSTVQRSGILFDELVALHTGISANDRRCAVCLADMTPTEWAHYQRGIDNANDAGILLSPVCDKCSFEFQQDPPDTLFAEDIAAHWVHDSLTFGGFHG